MELPNHHPSNRYLPRILTEPPRLDEDLATGPPTPGHALLINPFYPKDPHASFGKHVLTPTLALTSIAGATPPEWTVSYWDENLLQGHPPVKPFPSVVGISVHLTFAQRAYELARWYRRRGARVILGGLHVLSCPDEVAPHADALAIGEGVQIWPEILRDVARDRLRPRYVGCYRSPYREDPPPRREILPRRDFLTTSSVIATRGCHNRCGFCYLATDGLHMPYQLRDPEQVVAEVLDNDEPYFVFIDNNLGSKPDYLRRLCRALAPVHKIWSAAVTIDVTDDPSLVREMALAGCNAVFIGFESLTGENLDDANKKSPRPEEYARRVAVLHDHGIAVNGSFVFGFDHDRADVFDRTADWVEANRLECATFHILTPYPGTPLFRQYEAEGRLLHTDWNLYDTAHAVFRPRHMTPGELEAGYDGCYRRLFSAPSIWRRRPSRWSEVPCYLAMSYLYKKANRVWPFLIRHRLTHAAWRPFVEIGRLRQLRFRRRLAKRTGAAGGGAPVYGGV
ncbi:MAG: radical SAM protein [Acidobacteriota bacterium]|nr:radical SAM protein [Acidobacteriota bacterium]